MDREGLRSIVKYWGRIGKLLRIGKDWGSIGKY